MKNQKQSNKPMSIEEVIAEYVCSFLSHPSEIKPSEKPTPFWI